MQVNALINKTRKKNKKTHSSHKYMKQMQLSLPELPVPCCDYMPLLEQDLGQINPVNIFKKLSFSLFFLSYMKNLTLQRRWIAQIPILKCRLFTVPTCNRKHFQSVFANCIGFNKHPASFLL